MSEASSGRTLAPAPGSAPLARMVRAQAGLELRTQLRNGEQLLLTLVIPTLLLVLLTLVPFVDLGPGSRVDVVAPGILALAVMSTAFTGLAIQTGFERRYGVLKRLRSTPLPTEGLLSAKALAVLVVEAGQLVLLTVVAFALGWRPTWSLAPVLLLLLLGTAAFAGLGLLMAGTLRAEATLAAANFVYLLLLLLGGIVVPLDRFPAAVQPVLEALPSAALTEGLRQAFAGHGLDVAAALVLVAWTAVTSVAAALTFRWE